MGNYGGKHAKLAILSQSDQVFLENSPLWVILASLV